MNRTSALAALAAGLISFGCASVEPITGCDPVGDVTPLCGYQNPEDLALLPDGRSVLVSEYGGMDGEHQGLLSRLDLETGERHPLYAGGGNGEARWGDPACEGPLEALTPHGLDLSERSDGRLQLLVVQHHQRESVEFFEVGRDAAGEWQVAWRGCVEPPEGSWLNEVVGRPDGSFFASHMMPKGSAGRFFAMVSGALFGADTGHVWEWTPSNGFRAVPGTDAGFPNGVEVSPDGRHLFVNASLGGQVARVNLESGEVEGHAEVPTPDNLTWGPDGRLWVASLRPESVTDTLACDEITDGACPLAFAIVAIDPETLQTENLYVSDDTTPGGAGTVGLWVPGGDILVGTFAGDRILRVDRDAAPSAP
ncbi:MAG: SMP-30/gluconolactonase/LRE family protein [Myxococcota bacterium]